LAHFGGDSFSVKSAGIMIDEPRPYVSETTKKILREKGIYVVDENSILLTQDMVSWADKIIVVADNVPIGFFPNEKLIVWKVSDASERDEPKVRKIIDEIEKLVASFLEGNKK